MVRELGRQRIVRAAIRVADREGLDAVSMRRLATDLGTSPMALYRHISGKEELVYLMADVAYGAERLPAVPPGSWRAQLEVALRLLWRIHRKHPWMAQATMLTRPQFVRNGMMYTEWILRALDGLGLDANTMLHASVSLVTFVRSVGVSLEAEHREQGDTGLTDDEWMRTRARELRGVLASGAYPTLFKVVTSPGLDLDLDSLFEYGLQRELDGLAVLVGRAR